MTDNPGFNGKVWEPVSEVEIADAKQKFALLAANGRGVKPSEMALLFPGVNRRRVVEILDALVEVGHVTRHKTPAPGAKAGKGGWNEYKLV